MSLYTRCRSLFVLSFLALFLASFISGTARAEGCENRVGFGAGVIHRDTTPSATDFLIGADYECRLNPVLGLGGFFNHVFSDPSMTLIGTPQVFLHPLAGDFYVAASPLFQFGSGTGTHVGARLSARVPLPLGLFILVPSVAVDFINGYRHYIFGLGLQF